jgi:lysophospholipase L1-like esterase
MMHADTFFKKTFCAALIALTSLCGFAEAPKFEDGDRVCFIGDSITHQALYHTQILLFYATRFPQMRLEVWNSGLAGDTAAGAVRRYAWDIAPHKPTVATIMLGMNDVSRHLYAEGKAGPQIEAQRQKAIDDNIANMGKLASLLAKDGTRLIFITPSLFDQTGNQKTEKLEGVNDALKACGDASRKLAARYKAGRVDFNGPMEALNKTGQAKDPGFTIIGGDRVHPGPVGHLVMAYLFLKAQGISPTVADMAIDAQQRAVLKQDNCEISALSLTNGTLSFTCLEKALPFPSDASNEKALELVPFTADLNRETLKVTGLPEDKYELLIDGLPVLKTNATALTDGLNLAMLKNTPQYRQALRVQQLIAERAVVEGRKLRTFAQIEHLFFSPLKDRSPEIERKVLEENLASMRKTDNIWNRYRIGVIESYQKLLPEKASLEQQSAELFAKAFAANKPQVHLFALCPDRTSP